MTLQVQPMTAARLMRLAVYGVLSQKLDGVNVMSPGMWPVPAAKLPAVLVRSQSVRKDAATGRSKPPGFNASVTVTIVGAVSGATADAGQDEIEDLAYKVEQLVLMGHWINQVVQQFTSVSCDFKIDQDPKVPLASFEMQITMETFEDFDPTAVIPDGTTWPLPEPDYVVTNLQGVNLHIDAVQPADLTGTYTGSPFPSSVTPAPRTQGPDGRDEGYLQIDLPQA